MRSGIALGAACWLLGGLAALAPAGAEPDPGAGCPPGAAGALTLADGRPLRCADGRWQPFDDPYPHGDAWVSAGEELVLRGDARQNPNVDSGAWAGVPLDPSTRCAAVQTAAVPGQPLVGPPQTTTGDPGRALNLVVVPRLVELRLDGDCTWRRRADGN